MNPSNLIHSFAVASVIGLGVALGVAHAGSSIEFSSLTVPYDGLDLSRDADVKRLYARLQHASAQVCRPVPSSDPQFDAYQSCADAALDRAVQLVESPRLQTLHAATRSQHRWG